MLSYVTVSIYSWCVLPGVRETKMSGNSLEGVPFEVVSISVRTHTPTPYTMYLTSHVTQAWLVVSFPVLRVHRRGPLPALGALALCRHFRPLALLVWFVNCINVSSPNP